MEAVCRAIHPRGSSWRHHQECAAGTRVDYHTSLLNGTLANQLSLSGLRVNCCGHPSCLNDTWDYISEAMLANWVSKASLCEMQSGATALQTNSEHNCNFLPVHSSSPLQFMSASVLLLLVLRIGIVGEQNQVKAHLDRAWHGTKLCKP